MKALVQFVFSSVILIAISHSSLQVAHAKDMTSRLGVGFKDQSASGVASLAAQYWAAPDLGFSAQVGVDTQATQSRFNSSAKIYKVIFPEDHLNFYMGAGAGILSVESTSGGVSSNQSGFELMAFVGTEFFFSGLENLGFSIEVGTAITSLSSSTRFRTFGDSPLKAGVIFYF